MISKRIVLPILVKGLHLWNTCVCRVSEGVNGQTIRDFTLLIEENQNITISNALMHGLLIPMNKWQIFGSLITVFFMTLLPFLLLPYNFLLAIDTAIDTPSGQLSWKSDIPKQGPQQQLTLLSFYLNLTSCKMIIISTAIKDMKKDRITPTYSLLSLLGAGFIIISYIASIMSLFTKQSISWRGGTSRVTSNKVNNE
jgi:hypothetical protein